MIKGLKMLPFKKKFIKTWSRLIILVNLLLFNTTGIASEEVCSQFYNILEFGATGKGIVYDTDFIQSLVDTVAANGGGTIYFPPGKYLTKTIVLRNNITFYLDNGALILGSTEMNKFKPEFGSFTDSGGRRFGTALFFAKGAKRVVIKGEGIIDGQGYEKYYPKEKGLARPSIIRFIDCQYVRIEGITLINSAAWVQHYINCDDLILRGITVRSYSNKNNDGLDIESCQRVLITECNIDSEDDSIVMKALTTRPCKDIVISNCIVSGLKSAIKAGTESAGGFENISISNCTFYGTRGLTFYTVDGGAINNITVSNISMRDTYGVICLRLGNRMRPYSLSEIERPKSPGTFKNISFSNIQAVGVTESNCFISGIPGHNIENVTLDNIRISYKGDGQKKDSERKIPELTDEYPKPRMFGTLPAYGFFIRHASKVKLNNLFLTCEKPDFRSVIKCEDVSNLEINRLHADSHTEAAPFFWVKDSKTVRIQNCQPFNPVNTFLKVEGETTEKIWLIQNRIGLANDLLDIGEEVTEGEIIIRSNY